MDHEEFIMLTSFNALTNLISWVHDDEPLLKPLIETHSGDTHEYPGFNAEDLKPLCIKDSPTQIVYDCEESEAMTIQITSVNALFERI